MRTPIVILALLLTLPLVTAAPIQSYTWMPAQGEPSPEFGPDIPDTAPIASVAAFADEVWHGTEEFRFHTIDVPSGWTRVVMTYRQDPENDPWDRLFQASIANVEVLRGATPRSDMTITKDITRYASLLPQGGQAQIGAATGEYDEAQYVGYQHVWVTLDFYNDATSALVEGPASSVVPGYMDGGLCKDGVITLPSVTFPSSPNATIEFFASNHGAEEGYKLGRAFDILVDDHPLTTVVPSQYRYAWIGQYGGDTTVHPVLWWSAFRALDVAGVHTGVGEIPPYRLALDAQQMALLTPGTHAVTVHAKNVYDCVWITSLSFLMEK